MGSYIPPEGEYVRPAGRVKLLPKTYIDNHYVRGARYHAANFAERKGGAEIELELVPEPGNPHDHWAVALHLEGRRVGYVSAEDSGLWHDIVFAYNRAGVAVYADGLVQAYGERATGLIVLLPGFEDAEHLMSQLGLLKECDAVINALPEDVRERIMESERSGLSRKDVNLLRSQKHLAPSLNWQVGRGSRLEDRYPTALYRRLIARDQMERARIWEEKQAERRKAKRDRERAEEEKLATKAAAQVAFEARVLVLYDAGASMTAMRRELRSSDDRIKRVLQANGLRREHLQSKASRDTRLVRAQQALRLQEGGRTRREIAAELDCSLDTVKALLKDAKFYADPMKDLERLTLVMASRDSSHTGLSLDAAATRHRTTVSNIKNARRDFSIISALHPNLMKP